MSPYLPIKTSSRAGRFKKKLVTKEMLQVEAPAIEAKVGMIYQAFKEHVLSAPEFSALYLITVLSYRFPASWLGSKRSQLQSSHKLTFKLKAISEFGFSFENNILKRLEGIETIGDIFNSFALKSTPESVNRSILGWSTGVYGLELMFRIPTPKEVLNQQKMGRRCVTILLDSQKTKNYILNQRDALSFTMHDLIHADHFYNDNDCYEGQLGFYGFLDHCLRQGQFDELMKNKKFQDEFEYLIADMNAYAIHLLKCLKAAMIFYHPGIGPSIEEWINGVTSKSQVKTALLALNTNDYRESHDSLLLQFLNEWKQ